MSATGSSAPSGKLDVVDAETRLSELDLELPPSPAPVASYVPVTVSGGLAFVSGQVPLSDGAPIWRGRVGAEVDVPAGTEAARRCALQALSALRDELGSLNSIERIARVEVFVASAEGFEQQSTVANGASDLLADVFGEAGRHARIAIGVAGLPLGVPVEVSLVAELRAAGTS